MDMRYKDQGNDMVGMREFIPRSRAKDIWKVITGFGVALGLMLLLNLMPNSVGGATEASLVSLVIVSLLCFYIVYLKQQNLDLVMTTEFQNLLFAQAASIGYDFCLFVKRDGSITYSSTGIRKLFPSMHSNVVISLEKLFDAAHISTKHQEQVMSAIYANEKDKLIFTITAEGEAGPQKYIFSIDPLERPSGYAAIRGRKFVEGTQKKSSLSSQKEE
jgi:hypothetical protein